MQCYTIPADQGNPIAQCNLGVMHESCQSISQHYKRAAQWYTKAVEEGDVNAQCNLEVMYENGHGVLQDYKRAAQWYTKADNQGHACAAQCILLSVFYLI